MAEVGLDRALADVERGCDLLVRLAVGHQAERRHLARRQLHARHAFGQLGGRRWSDERFPGEHGADAADEIVSGDVFQDVRLRARLQRPLDLVVGVVGRQDDHERARIALANSSHDFDAFHPRHPQVEQHHIGTMLLPRLDGLDAIAGLGDHFEIGFLIDDVGDAGPEQRVVVDEEHARASRRGGRLNRQCTPASAMMTAARPARLRCHCAAR